MRLAFDRDLIGPAMYFGLMGDGQPIGSLRRYVGWLVHQGTHFLLSLEDIIPFFQNVKLSKEATIVQQCYIEFSKMVTSPLVFVLIFTAYLNTCMLPISIDCKKTEVYNQNFDIQFVPKENKQSNRLLISNNLLI
ncbi:hypothetical protein YC2023_040270 [Brassica napus]